MKIQEGDILLLERFDGEIVPIFAIRCTLFNEWLIEYVPTWNSGTKTVYGYINFDGVSPVSDYFVAIIENVSR